MKRIVIIFLILILFIHIDTKASVAKKIDLKIKEDETNIVFLNLENSKSLLIKDDENSNLFILDYKNDTNLKQTLEIFGSHPNVFYLNKKYNKKIDNIYIFNQKNILKFRINNYTICIYNNEKQKINNCDFVYIMNLNKSFELNENISAIFYNDNVEKKYLSNVNESWIESSIVSKDSFTILKLNEDSYNILIVPSTNN